MNLVRNARPSLRSQFAWTFAGNAVHGAAQWAILSLIAKLGNAEMLGQYALFIAIALPVAMLCHLNLRAVLATDVQGLHPFADYRRVRLTSIAVGMAIIAGLGLMQGLDSALWAALLLIGAGLMFENTSDLYYAWMQRRERLDMVSQSMMLRAAITLTAAGVALWMFGTVLAAAAALALGRLVTLVLYDIPRSGAPSDAVRAPWQVLQAATPLGLVLMLTSLTANVPRYAIERHLGLRELGAFAAVASFMTIGTTIANALGQSATTRLASHFSGGQRRAFRRLAIKMVALAAGLGACGTLIAWAGGAFFLSLIYRPEYAQYKGALVAVMMAGTLLYMAVILGYVLTSTRTFAAQIPLLCLVAGACGLTSLYSVPAFGLQGAALAIGVAGCVQIAGQLFLLSRAS